MSASSLYAGDQVTINFTAQIVASTCSITAGSGKIVDEDMGALYLYNPNNAAAGDNVSPSDIGMTKPLTKIEEIIKCSTSTAPAVSYATDTTVNRDGTFHDILMLADGSSTTTSLGIRLNDDNATTQPAYLDFTKTPADSGVVEMKTAGVDQYAIDLTPQLAYTHKATVAALTALWSSGTTLTAKAVINLSYS